MKILQISNYYYPHIGGIEQVAQDCAEAFKGNYEQKVFCFNHKRGNVQEEINGIEVIRAGSFAKVASQSLSFSYGKLLKKTFREFKPDLVIFHYPNPFGAHYLLKILKKYPECKLVVYWHLDIVKQKLLGKLFKGQNKRLLNRAEKIIATSPNYIEGSKYLSANRDKCEVVSCCVNSERMKISESDLAAARAIKEQNSDKTICVAVGRHVPYKGTEYLVRASKLLGEGFKIFIIGEGPLTKSLKKLAAGDEKISFLGKVATPELKAYLLASDIFCFPSVTKNEAFGIALAEAMCFKKPSVTFTVEGSGINYVSLNGVTGIEVENGNVDKYAEAINTLAENKQLCERFGQAAFERVQTLFTQDVIRNRLLSLVKSIETENL